MKQIRIERPRAGRRAGGPRARYGAPAKELRSVTAAGRDADAIVIGAPGRFPHRFAGSVAAWLARHARCPAVIVP